MIIPNFKFITYLGGSGGDMFVTSANGCSLTLERGFQTQTNSIKQHEHLIEQTPEKLLELANDLRPGYVSTHMFSQLIELDVDLISIVIQMPEIQDQIILRQMYLQKLRLDVKPDQTFFKIIKKLCFDHEYDQAAKVWLHMARQLWRNSMQIRLANTKIKSLNFDKLFDNDFVDSLVQQGWNVNIDVLENNHQEWLLNNPWLTETDTLRLLSQKIKTLDWTSTQTQLKSKTVAEILVVPVTVASSAFVSAVANGH